jgi:hypothetical protein
MNFKPMNTSMPVRKSAGAVSRHIAPAVHPGKTPAQSQTQYAPPIVQEVVESPGEAMNAEIRQPSEARFSHDFGRLRIHTDEKAAASALTVNANAYTVGSHIVFGQNQYQPRSERGLRLIAHELAHVVQQQNVGETAARIKIGSPASAAETEAKNSANALTRGDRIAPIKSRTSNPTVQRSLFGDVGGTLAGAGAGAGLGFLLGGPIGAGIGGLIGGVAGLIAGDTVSADTRPLDTDEEPAAKSVFGNSLDWSKVRVAETSVMTIGGYARTPFNTVYLEPGTSKQPFADRMPQIIHELTHVWQTQHGISVVRKTLTAMRGGGAYTIGGRRSEGYEWYYGTPEEQVELVRTRALGQRFTDFNTEQQGDICMHYYYRRTHNMDVAPYEPFINDVKGISGTGGEQRSK